VDIGACIAAFIALIQNKELRVQMGNAGRNRAMTEYDWGIIVRKYQELWGELAVRRLRDRETAPLKKGKPAIPLRLDPFTLFQEYPTAHIKRNCLFTLQAGKYQGWLEHISTSVMNNYVVAHGNLMLSRDEQKIIIDHLSKHESVTVADIVKLFPKAKEDVITCTIGWMGKSGIIAIQPLRQQSQVKHKEARTISQENAQLDQAGSLTAHQGGL